MKRLRSPRSASSAIFAFSSPENLRRFPLICILRQTVEYTLATCPIFRGHLRYAANQQLTTERPS